MNRTDGLLATVLELQGRDRIAAADLARALEELISKMIKLNLSDFARRGRLDFRFTKLLGGF